ncbi:MAG: acyl-[acyl-carrier-protein]-phospholipid O-acyltransferase [Saprospiraceae bacterium]|jgi:acyl-[acyl-carrier-protein]-phospholipid O-acyltransferase/long-chain-fatty-acid--[acyl-carrier-protein] ligase
MSTEISGVTSIRGYKPYLLMLFLNAFVDLGHKIIIQNTVFKIYDGQTQVILIAVVNATILLPYVLLFTPAAFLSDRFQFIKVMRFSAWLATGITCCICFFYYTGRYQAAFLMTLVLAVQSALYSPAKYGYIRQLVGANRLTEGNALVQATTIISILLGTLIFSILFEKLLSGHVYQNESEILQLIAPAAWLLIISSVAELISAYRLPEDEPKEVGAAFSWLAYFRGHALKDNLAQVTGNKAIWGSVAGLSAFWGVSQMILASFPAYAKVHLGELNTVVIQGIIGGSGVGILVGSLFVNRFSKGRIEKGFIPLGAVGLALALLLIPLLSSKMALLGAFFLVGLFGAFLIAPLNALIQFNADTAKLGTVIAANNWLQNCCMLSFLGVTILIALTGLDSIWLLYFVVAVASVSAIYSVKVLLRPFLQLFLVLMFKMRYKVEVCNKQYVPTDGCALLLSNHISWVDWAFVQMAIPRQPVRFVIDRLFYDFWLLNWPLKEIGTVPISVTKNRLSIKEINQALKQQRVICLFPEGGISQDGSLQALKRGFELSLKNSGAAAVPVYISGMQGSLFTRNKPSVFPLKKWVNRRKVEVHFSQHLGDNATVGEVETVLKNFETISN